MNMKKVVDCNKRMFANSMCVKQTNTNRKLNKKVLPQYLGLPCWITKTSKIIGLIKSSKIQQLSSKNYYELLYAIGNC